MTINRRNLFLFLALLAVLVVMAGCNWANVGGPW
jgi:hypothetical protein